MSESPAFFEAVYYSQAVPSNKQILTLLGLVFDRIHFPAVYMPIGFDEQALEGEFNRINNLRLPDPGTRQLLQCLAFAQHNKYLADLCVFAERPVLMERLETGVHEVVDQLENMVFGPRREGFIPDRTGPWIKGLSGGDPATSQISAPDTITYPANALLFAARNGLPLVNDVEWLPVPGIPTDPKSNAKLLAMLLTLESVRLSLPNIKPLEPEALRDFREEVAPHVKPFRIAMLKLAKELNGAIQSSASVTDVQKEAKFLVQTDVYPRLSELERMLQNPVKHWYHIPVELAKAAPQLAANFATMPREMALAQALAKVVGVLSSVRDQQIAAEDQVARTGLYYLLKISEKS